MRWPITTNGEAIDLAGRDLRLVMHSPLRDTTQLDFITEGNVAVIRIDPKVQTSVGSYSFTMWENSGKDGQTAVDSCRAFSLVSTTCAESNGSHSNIEVEEVVELESGDMTFTPIIVGGGGTIAIDDTLSITSENAVQNKVVTQAISQTAQKAEDARTAAENAMDEAVSANAAAEVALQIAANKQDKIADIDAIRQGAAKGATALQEHQDISGKLDKTEAADLYQPKGNYQSAGDYATNEALKNEITRATNEEKNIRALAEANKAAIEQLAGVEDGGSVVIVVDPALSETSENPVQNKAVTKGINEAKAAAVTAEQNAKDYTDDLLKNYAKTEDLPEIPAMPDLSGLATKEEVSAVEKKIPTIPSNVSSFNNDAGYQTSNDVQEAIKGKANTSDIPTKTSELTNDSGFITADDIPDVDTSTLATKTELSQGLATKQDTIGDLDTIRAGAAKGATAIQEHQSLEGYAKTADLAKVATSGSYEDLSDKPTIPAEQVNADWNATSGKAQILNKPTIPTVPSNVSAFNNDAGYITEEDIPEIPDTSNFATKTDIEPLNASFTDVAGEAEEPELPWVLYTDGVVGDINTILDNINGEEA